MNMTLFRFEMKKLLLNRNRLLLLVGMIIMVTLMALLKNSPVSDMRKSNGYQEYLNLSRENSGKLKPEQLAESKRISEADMASYVDKYGKNIDEQFAFYLNRNPQIKFHYDYVKFSQRVDGYWNGPEGVHFLEDKVKALANQQNTYEYRYYQKLLATEFSHGEPIFVYTQFWDFFSTAFEPMFIVFLLLMALAFFIAPVFTQEVRADMNSILLCSLKGRREIVTAKLLSVCMTATFLTVVYFGTYFIVTYVVNGNIAGFDAPARSSGFEGTAINTTVGGMAFIGILWTTLAAITFGLVVGLISAFLKNQMSVFGLSVAIILAHSLMGFISGDSLPAIIQPLKSFNVVALSLYYFIFSKNTLHNFLGTPISWGLESFMICVTLSVITVLLIYLAQRKRSVA